MTPSETPPSGDDPGVLSGLSRTRPQRRSNKRPGRPAPAADGAIAPAADPPATGPRKPATRAASTARKPAARGAASKTTRPAPKAARPAAAQRGPKTSQERPAVEVGRVAEPRGTDRERTTVSHDGGGTDLLGQAVHAAGEVAQLGIGISRQVAKGILSRLPKP